MTLKANPILIYFMSPWPAVTEPCLPADSLGSVGDHHKPNSVAGLDRGLQMRINEKSQSGRAGKSKRNSGQKIKSEKCEGEIIIASDINAASITGGHRSTNHGHSVSSHPCSRPSPPTGAEGESQSPHLPPWHWVQRRVRRPGASPELPQPKDQCRGW